MSTPNGATTSYATPTQFLMFKDYRLIGDLVLDTGVRATSSALLTDDNVQNALNWASGEIESACLTGDKYTVADLQALTGMSQALLQGLVCDLAFWKLLTRRYPTMAVTEEYRAAMEKLEKLRFGERIFALQAQGDAGLPNDSEYTPPSTAGLTTTIACRYFGVRGRTRAQYGDTSNGCGCC